MASINTMVKRLAGLADTADVTDWENQFIKSILDKTSNGYNTTSITEKQLDVIERIHDKHFVGER